MTISMNIKINQVIEKPIQYKGVNISATFVEVHKCNLKCLDCNYAPGSKKNFNVQNIIKKIQAFNNNLVVITGGEPLLQDSIFILIYELKSLGYDIVLETNSSLILDEDFFNRSYSICTNIKSLKSGCSNRNIYDNLAKLHYRDIVTFNIYNLEEYNFAKEIIRKYPTKATLVLNLKTEDIAEDDFNNMLFKDCLDRVRRDYYNYE